ncbi:unnamed protein product [Acanthoscelides obtectus]|uniref:Uncharacterized protein n=1 Tax=Acanthoscelides obtectus TaxID=200917 RepID=A0A9P0KYS2_ACAOB|nr:unnamed protein product [Acanthoscelides obtectus]CAK1676346.1 hypothetical protein AOBTE_LOCUS30703 [Acanthoscelides obtectus]
MIISDFQVSYSEGLSCITTGLEQGFQNPMLLLAIIQESITPHGVHGMHYKGLYLTRLLLLLALQMIMAGATCTTISVTNSSNPE